MILGCIESAEREERTGKIADFSILQHSLGYELHGPADLLDLLLSQLGHKLGLHQQRLLRQLPLAQHFEDAELGHVDHGGLLAVLGRRFPGLRRRRKLSKWLQSHSAEYIRSNWLPHMRSVSLSFRQNPTLASAFSMEGEAVALTAGCEKKRETDAEAPIVECNGISPLL